MPSEMGLEPVHHLGEVERLLASTGLGEVRLSPAADGAVSVEVFMTSVPVGTSKSERRVAVPKGGSRGGLDARGLLFQASNPRSR